MTQQENGPGACERLGCGERFQRETKHVRGRLVRGDMDWSRQPPPYKDYPDAPVIPLEPPVGTEGPTLWQTLAQRRSQRRFGGQAVTLAETSRLLWAAQGATARAGHLLLRTAPSAGALYPIETYLIVHRVEGLEPGVYHYDVRRHALEQLQRGDLRQQTARAALDQRSARDADLVLAWTAVFGRSRWKYGERAYRYVYLDAGHIAQNAALAAVALGLGSCQVAALYDEEVNALLGADGEQESVVYMTVVGRPAGQE